MRVVMQVRDVLYEESFATAIFYGRGTSVESVLLLGGKARLTKHARQSVDSPHREAALGIGLNNRSSLAEQV
jgi:hypothetical protein